MVKKLKTKVNINFVVQICLFAFLIAADRITKVIVVSNLKGQDPVVLIENVLELRYLENSGAAFGILQNKQWVFYIITAIILLAVAYIWIGSIIKIRKYTEFAETNKNKFLFRTYDNILFLGYLLAALGAGAIGNLIDRLTTKYVIDFIYFKFIDFPIFNFADICVTVTAVLLIIFFIFMYKEDSNFSLFGSTKKKED